MREALRSPKLAFESKLLMFTAFQEYVFTHLVIKQGLEERRPTQVSVLSLT